MANKLIPMPPQNHVPVHAWAGAPETMMAPQVQGGVFKTLEQWRKTLPDIEPHHIVIFDSKAG